MSRVLVVDDEASICWALREFLGDLGHEMEVASSAEEGLDLAGRGPLDAIILDVRLPGIDGLSALGRFRELAGSAPIIVITAFGNLDTAVRAMEGGALTTWSSRLTSTRPRSWSPAPWTLAAADRMRRVRAQRVNLNQGVSITLS